MTLTSPTSALEAKGTERVYIVRELIIEVTTAYREMMLMNHEDFKEILKAIEPDLTQRQVMGVIVAAERLTLTIQFLATGETYQSLNFQLCIS